MPIWKDTPPKEPTPPPPAPTPTGVSQMRQDAPTPMPSAPRAAGESVIAPDIAIEGTISGQGHVRIAGRFKGDINVQGNLTIEAGAKVTGSVRAGTVTIAGELEGNIEAATRVELQQTGVLVGDVKSGSLTVAAGSKMRGNAEFGWDEKAGRTASVNAA
jgi:cytoskeletal protein CcmA (bactofilin family)